MNSTLHYHIAAAAKLAQGSSRKRHSNTSNSGDIEQHIESALELSGIENALQHEPIRTIHHLSCTGGTLFAKCIASMPNVLVLNEVNLHSELTPAHRGRPGFTPTDMVSLLKQGDRRVSSDIITRLFLSDLELLREEQWRIGRHIVLRDHSHSHFLTGPEISKAPLLQELVASKFPTLSIVTVRDPIDSYTSMEKQDWLKHFSPSTFEAYCERYLAFLDAHESANIFKYEDFLENPKQIMPAIAQALRLKYFEGFEEVFSNFRFSGDSGRGGTTIAPRPRRPIDPGIEAEMLECSSYKCIALRLGYL